MTEVERHEDPIIKGEIHEDDVFGMVCTFWIAREGCQKRPGQVGHWNCTQCIHFGVVMPEDRFRPEVLDVIEAAVTQHFGTEEDSLPTDENDLPDEDLLVRWDNANVPPLNTSSLSESYWKLSRKPSRPIKPIPTGVRVSAPRRHFPMVEVPAPSRLRLWLRRQAQRIAWGRP